MTTETVSVLFTDVVGSTALRGTLGDDRFDEIRRIHDDASVRSVEAHRGQVVKHTGDGLMAVFVAAGDALDAAVSLQQVTRLIAQRERTDLSIRVGASVGDVSNEDDDYFGLPVVGAARLCALGGADEILVADVVRLLAGTRGGHQLSPRGALELDGLEAPVTAWSVAWSPAASGLPLPGSLRRAHRSPLVGRDEERECIVGAWKEVQSGARRVVVIAGEPGIGKTRLATEIALAAHEEGATVLLGRADDALMPPYGPFVDALRVLLTGVPVDELRLWAVSHGSVLAPLVHEVDGLFPGLEPPPPADPETERRRVVDAFDALLVVTGEHGAPVVLVLDDLHWADRDTIVALRLLASSANPAPLLVLVTYRDTDLDRTHPLAELLADLRRVEGVVRLRLRGLTVAATAQLIGSWAGHEVEAEFTAAVHDETEGNPFFVEEVLVHLAESGALVQDDGRWSASGPVAELGIPEGVREAIGRRLTRLDPTTNDVLHLAAVIGREFDLPLLAAVADRTEDAMLDAIEPAIRAELVAETERPDGFSFSHALVRSTLYDELPSARRVRLHRRVGEAIERLHATALSEHAEELAHHFGEAAASGDAEPAVRYSRAAAHRAMQAGSWTAGITHLRRAVALVDDVSADPVHRAQLVSDLCLSLSLGPNRAEAADLLYESIAAARSSNGEAFGHLVLGLGNLSTVGTPNQVELSLIDEALGCVTSGHELAHALRALRALIVAMSSPSRAEWSAATNDAATSLAALDGSPFEALALSASYSCLWGRPQAERLLEIADAMTAMAENARPGLNAASSYFGMRGASNGLTRRATASLQLGDRSRFDAAIDDPRSRLSEVPWHVAWRAQLVATVALLEGRLDDAATESERSQSTAAGNPNFVLGYHSQQQQILYERDRLDAAVLCELADAFPGFPALRTQVALLFAERGDHDDARALLAPLAEGGFDESVPHDLGQAIFLREAAEAVAHLGETEWAEALLLWLEPYDGQLLIAYTPTSCEGSAARSIALLETVLGRIDDADGHFAAGLALEEGFGGRTLAARTRVWWARMLIRRGAAGDVGQATKLLDDAITEADELGLANVARLARATQVEAR